MSNPASDQQLGLKSARACDWATSIEARLGNAEREGLNFEFDGEARRGKKQRYQRLTCECAKVRSRLVSV